MGSSDRACFLHDWQGCDCAALAAQFGISERELADARILLASYVRDACCGEAFVLFRRHGRLYEVNASHNSVGGLEGQWEPEETLIEALRYRLQRGRLGCDADGSSLFVDELCFLLAELEAT